MQKLHGLKYKEDKMNEIQFLIYEDGEKVQVLVQDETIWASQKTIADLFGVDRTSISRHLKNIFETEELDEKVVSAEIAHTTQHGAIKGKTVAENSANHDEENMGLTTRKNPPNSWMLTSDFDNLVKKLASGRGN